MGFLLRNGFVYMPEGFRKADVFVSGERVFVDSISSEDINSADRIIDCAGKAVVPGFTDVHVHLREPGFFYKETIATGTAAAARGGYTCVCPMPNLKPAPADLDSLKVQLDIIDRDAKVRVIPYGTITKGQNGRSALSDMEALAPYVCAFSDDGKGIQTGELMEEAMIKAASLGKLIVAHCEDESLLTGGWIHEGKYAAEHGHKGISSESEWKQVERDVALAEKTGAAYHVCHISTKETVDIIRKAKAKGINVTCETGPHYLVMCEDDLEENGRFKMNPPLRSREDKEALIEGIIDGTIDMIATDHAPHSAEEKSKGLEGSAFGIVGLETSFPVLYTKLVAPGVITLTRLIEMMSIAPRIRFGLPGGRSDMIKTGVPGTPDDEKRLARDYAIQDGCLADVTVLDITGPYVIDSAGFESKGKATPFEGWTVCGRAAMTIVGGKIVWENK